MHMHVLCTRSHRELYIRTCACVRVQNHTCASTHGEQECDITVHAQALLRDKFVCLLTNVIFITSCSRCSWYNTRKKMHKLNIKCCMCMCSKYWYNVSFVLKLQFHLHLSTPSSIAYLHSFQASSYFSFPSNGHSLKVAAWILSILTGSSFLFPFLPSQLLPIHSPFSSIFSA